MSYSSLRESPERLILSQVLHHKQLMESLKAASLEKYVAVFGKVAAVLDDTELDAFIAYHVLEGRLLTLNAVIGLF